MTMSQELGEDQMQADQAEKQVEEPIEIVMEKARDSEEREREDQDPRPKANEQ